MKKRPGMAYFLKKITIKITDYLKSLAQVAKVSQIWSHCLRLFLLLVPLLRTWRETMGRVMHNGNLYPSSCSTLKLTNDLNKSLLSLSLSLTLTPTSRSHKQILEYRCNDTLQWSTPTWDLKQLIRLLYYSKICLWHPIKFDFQKKSSTKKKNAETKTIKWTNHRVCRIILYAEAV